MGTSAAGICFRPRPDLLSSQAAPPKGAALGKDGKDRRPGSGETRVEETRQRINTLSAQAGTGARPFGAAAPQGTEYIKRDQPATLVPPSLRGRHFFCAGRDGKF